MPTKPPLETVTGPASPEGVPDGRFTVSSLSIIMVTAFAVLLPSFFLGIPSGHDFEFHMNSWMEVLSQWRQGILYPRWAALAHYGYGEARFIFYPPASWMLGAALGSFLPWKIVPGVYEWIALTLSGCSMFILARSFLPGRDALFAAALYAANPYHIVIVYWRSAFAELLVSALLPLLLLIVLRSQEDGRKTILPLSLIVAAAWLTNVPAALMLTYSLALLLLIVAFMRRSPQPLAIGAAALLLGLSLAAFYVVPVLYEQKWVDISQVLSPGVRPQDNFLFTPLNNPDHDRFNLLISIVATTEIILLAIVSYLSRRWRARTPQVWWTITAWWAAAAFLMWTVSFVLYRILPEIRFVQLPLRWLLCLNLAFALLVTMASRRWLVRAVVCVVMLTALAWGWRRVQPPWWDQVDDIVELQDNHQNGQGYEGIEEYVPTGADFYDIKKDARRVSFVGNGSSRIHVTQWAPESKFFTADVSQPGNLVLKLFNYPAWRVEVNGRPVETGALPVTDQIVIPVDAGKNQVHVSFARTTDRIVGGFVSFAAILLLLVLTILNRRAGAFKAS